MNHTVVLGLNTYMIKTWSQIKVEVWQIMSRYIYSGVSRRILDCVVRTIKQIHGGRCEYLIRAQFGLTSIIRENAGGIDGKGGSSGGGGGMDTSWKRNPSVLSLRSYILYRVSGNTYDI